MSSGMRSVSALHFAVAGTDIEIVLHTARLIVAGYTGRDETAVRAHIDELAAIGIPPPSAVPMYYDLDPALLTCEDSIKGGGASSGEVEPVFLRHGNDWYLGVGSDHTDRVLERADVKAAKAACAKPVGTQVIPLPAGVVQGGYDEMWEAGTMSCRVDGEPYQSGPLTALRTPSDLLERVMNALRDNEAENDASDLVVFAGTVPLIDGEFRCGTDWQLQIDLPDLTLTHHYQAL